MYGTSDYMANGYLARKGEGRYEGEIMVEGISLSPIQGMYFKSNEGKMMLWIKRKRILEYDDINMRYTEREREPRFETYMNEVVEYNERRIAFRGEFMFLRLRFTIIGIWDTILGNKKDRLNLYVERMPMEQQTIVNNINKLRKEKT